MKGMVMKDMERTPAVRAGKRSDGSSNYAEPKFHAIPVNVCSKQIMVYVSESNTFWQKTSTAKMHEHPKGFYEVILFRNGSARIITQDGCFIAKEDSVAVIAPGYTHRLILSEAEGEEEATCATFLMEPDEKKASDSEGRTVEQFFQMITDVTLISDAGAYFPYVNEAIRELESREIGHLVCSADLFGVFLIGMMRAFLQRVVRSGNSLSLQTEPLQAVRIEEFLSHAVTEGSSLQELAGRLHMSIRQLERYIQRLYRKSYRSLIFEMRMKYAQQLLSESETPLKEIADTLGYSSVNAFYSSFHRYCGSTPLQYRKEMRYPYGSAADIRNRTEERR